MSDILSNPAAAGVGRESWTALLDLASREVFSVMLASSLSAAPESFPQNELDVTAMVGLAGQVCGILSIRCPTRAAAVMASKMLGIDAANAGPEIWDAVGEVCNMIAGDFKHKIAGMSDGCLLSVPTVITGADYNLHPLTNSDRIEVNLLFEGLPLVVGLELHS
jgi:chemotaxis protein CheX